MTLRGTPPCRICGDKAEQLSTGRVINGYALVRCATCGTVLVNRSPDPGELARVYDEMFSAGDYTRHRQEFEHLRAGGMQPQPFRAHLLKRVEQATPGRNMIEIGGGSGAFGVLARSRGWSYRVFDVSAVAVDFARQLGLDADVFDGAAIPPLAPSVADAVVMWEVLEHVWSMREYLETVHRALRPGGILVFSTPNYLRSAYQQTDRWEVGMAPPVHLNFFTGDSLRHVLRRAGFESPHIIQRRFFRPASLSPGALARSVKRLLGIEAPPTLFGMAVRT